MPTLNWIGKAAVVNHHRKVGYHLLRCDKELSAGDGDAGICTHIPARPPIALSLAVAMLSLGVRWTHEHRLRSVWPLFGLSLRSVVNDCPRSTTT
jgi:hypothetical protein